MYTNLNINQALEEIKSRINKAIYYENYKGKVLPYLQSLYLTKSDRRVAEEILSYRSLHRRNGGSIQLKYQTIADALGISRRTVIRAVKKLVEHGLIIKYQLKNEWVPNHFVLNPLLDGKAGHDYWMHTHPNLKTEEQKLTYIQFGEYVSFKGLARITKRNVTHAKDNNIYIYLNTHTARARVRECDDISLNGIPKLDKIKEKHKERSLKRRDERKRTEKGIAMVKQSLKEYVNLHGNTPSVRQLLNSERVKPYIITPVIERLTRILELDPREQLRLSGYAEEVLEHCCAIAEDVAAGRMRAAPIRDRFGWFLKMADNYSKTIGIGPDWKFYYQLCNILNIRPFEPHEEPIPLKIKEPVIEYSSKTNKFAPQSESKTQYHKTYRPEDYLQTTELKKRQRFSDHQLECMDSGMRDKLLALFPDVCEQWQHMQKKRVTE